MPQSDIIHRGETYDTETYGTVRVVRFDQRIHSANQNGVLDSTLNVVFTIKPDEQHILEHHEKKLPVARFIEFLEI